MGGSEQNQEHWVPCKQHTFPGMGAAASGPSWDGACGPMSPVEPSFLRDIDVVSTGLILDISHLYSKKDISIADKN